MTLALLVSPPPLGLVAAGAALLLSLLGLSTGLMAMNRPVRSPERALAVAILLLAIPVVLAIALLRDSGASSLSESAHAQSAAGSAGIALALPVGLASGLWGGIASARRAHRAGERARLAAQAAGHPEAGQLAAAIIGRSTAPRLGALAGIVAAALVVLPTSIGLLASGHSMTGGLADAPGLIAGSPMYRGLLAADAARLLREGTEVSGAGAILLSAMLAALHIGSSRRRNAGLALRALQEAGYGKAAISAATSGLLASGKPNARGPLLLAALLLALSIVAIWEARRLSRPFAPQREGVASSNWRAPAART